MKDSTLIRISISIAMCGLIALYLLSEREPGAGSSGQASGIVKEIANQDKLFLIRMSGDVDVVVFKTRPDEIIDIREGDSINVIGDEKEYQGKKEIIADKITLR